MFDDPAALGEFTQKERLCRVIHQKSESLAKMRSSSGHHPTSLESWGYGVLCVTLISLMSVTGVFLLPLMSKSFYRKLLSALIGLAVGSLLGED